MCPPLSTRTPLLPFNTRYTTMTRVARTPPPRSRRRTGTFNGQKLPLLDVYMLSLGNGAFKSRYTVKYRIGARRSGVVPPKVRRTRPHNVSHLHAKKTSCRHPAAIPSAQGRARSTSQVTTKGLRRDEPRRASPVYIRDEVLVEVPVPPLWLSGLCARSRP